MSIRTTENILCCQNRVQSSGFLEEGGQITGSLFRLLFLEPREVALSLIVPGTRLHPRHLMLPWEVRAHRNTQTHTSPGGQSQQSTHSPLQAPQGRSTALPGHPAQTRSVLPAAPSSLANLGGPSCLALQNLPWWGRKETENVVLHGCHTL